METSHAEEAEPTLDEVMDEPIIQLLMQKDGVERHRLADLLCQATAPLKSASPER